MNNSYKDLINERIEQYGISTLTDAEALNVLTGVPLFDIQQCIESYGLPELIKFTGTMNITKIQAKKLKLIYHLTKRINVSDYKEKPILNSSSKSGEYFMKELQFEKNEVFAVALLDSQNRLIKTVRLFIGTINEAPVYPREIISLVLNYNANSIIIAHNHPGGTISPSQADIDVTNKVNSALKTISVKLIDHIIIAENRYTSLAEKGLLN